MSHWVGKHFRDDEFACKCGCGSKLVHLRLVEILDAVRGKLRTPLEITSGVRCVSHNKNVGGRSSSFHVPQTIAVDGSSLDLGFAADVTFAKRHLRQPISIVRLYIALESAGRSVGVGLGLYPTWVHIDVRGILGRSPARWDEGFPWPRL